VRLSTILLCIGIFACADTDGGTGLESTGLMDSGQVGSCPDGEVCLQYDAYVDSAEPDLSRLDSGVLDADGLDAKTGETLDGLVSMDMAVLLDADLDVGLWDGGVLEDQAVAVALDVALSVDGALSADGGEGDGSIVAPDPDMATMTPDAQRPLPDLCYNGMLDEGESEIDCDGLCAPCLVFVECSDSSECGAQTCYEGRCVPSHCDDGLLNNNEAEIDCGGGCGQCVTEGCLADVDCARGRCEASVCIPPVCGNGVVDEGEECDDGNLFRFDGCLPDCVLAGSQLCIGECSSQGTRLTPAGDHLNRVVRAGGTAGDGFGLALAKSNDQVFVGAPFANVTGSVSVHNKQNDGLVSVEELFPRDVTTPELFGASLVADRDTLLVGAPSAMEAGVVYVFRRRGGERWVQTQILSPATRTPGLKFGQGSLAIQGDIAIIGVPNDSTLGANSGAVYVYRKGGDGRFVQVQKLMAQDGVAHQDFGESVSILGGTVLVGAPALQSAPNGYARFKGAAYLFDFDGTSWIETQKLVATGPPSLNGYNFGTAVELVDRGALVTAPREDFTAAQSGVVYFFRRTPGAEALVDQKFGLPEPAPGSLFGMSVYTHQDLILIGQPFRMSLNGLNNAGGVAVFQQLASGRFRFAGVWENAFAERNAFYGARVLVLDDVAVISTHGDPAQGAGAGAVTLVTLRSPLCDLQGRCICEEGAQGTDCAELTLCGDGIVQPSEACDVALFSQVCEPGCILPNCSDNQQNGNETDVDCGGSCGSTCASGEVCVTDFDCTSRSCGLSRLCQAPNCFDDIQNGDEPDVDCGHTCGIACVLGQYCYDNQDCESGICGVDGLCKPMRRIDGPQEALYQDFGGRLALDGDRMLVGAPSNDQVASNVGAAYIYLRSENGLWERETTLFPSSTNNNMRFGASVALFGDVAVVGAPGTSPLSDFNTGSVFVYRRGALGWTLTQQLVTSDGPYSTEFGAAVAVTADNVVVGASQGLGGSRGTVRNAGSAHVFRLNAEGLFEESTKLFDVQGGAASRFGLSLAVDGDNLVVGASGDDFNQGAVLTYRRVTDIEGVTTWQLNRKLVLPDQTIPGHFGYAVALSGTQLVVSAPKAMSGDVRAGVVQFYEYHASGNWLQQEAFGAVTPLTLGAFGYAVRMSGPLLLVSQMPSVQSEEESLVFQYELDEDDVWQLSITHGAPPAFEGTRFGTDLSIGDDLFIIGAPGSEQGSVYLYERTDIQQGTP
jgi:cysteine-rich repeat protein